MEFKDLLKQRRVELKITQAHVADQLSQLGHETSPARVGHWETGRNRVPLENPEFRLAIASVLQMDVNEMMIELGFALVNVSHSPEARVAAQIIERLPSPARARALDYLRQLAAEYGAD